MLRFFASLTVVVSLCACAFGAEGASATLVASASATPISSAPMLTIRKQVEEVRVTFHAFDKHKHPVLNLPKASLAVLDNGAPVSSISGFDIASDLPLSVAIMVDASDSVSRDFAAEEQASRAFVRTLVRSTDDRVLLVAFRDKIEMIRRMDRDTGDFASAIRNVKVGGLTALYDAVVSTSSTLADTDTSASRRAIIVISDGDDTDSRNPLKDAISTALRNDVAVYAIRVHSRHATLEGENALKQLAQASGGRVYNLNGRDELVRAMEEIERDLRTQYFVTYRPVTPTVSGFHTLKLSSSVKDVSIRARNGYFAGDRH
jgi:Ca-activated chloride channel homolog